MDGWMLLLSELVFSQRMPDGGLPAVAFCAHTLLWLLVRDDHNCAVRQPKLCEQRRHSLGCVSSKALMGALPTHLSGQLQVALCI